MLQPSESPISTFRHWCINLIILFVLLVIVCCALYPKHPHTIEKIVLFALLCNRGCIYYCAQVKDNTILCSICWLPRSQKRYLANLKGRPRWGGLCHVPHLPTSPSTLLFPYLYLQSVQEAFTETTSLSLSLARIVFLFCRSCSLSQVRGSNSGFGARKVRSNSCICQTAYKLWPPRH